MDSNANGTSSDIRPFTQGDQVRAHTPPEMNRQLDQQMLDRLMAYARQHPGTISRRILQLNREWDIERYLGLQASVTALLSVWLGLTKSRKWLLLAIINQGFLLQHSLGGWCPPVAMYRQFGVRTRREIEAEKNALKALRGDYERLPGEGKLSEKAQAALQASRLS